MPKLGVKNKVQYWNKIQWKFGNA